VILLGVGMPTLNGYQVCSKLKETENPRNMPVIFSTGHDSETDEIAGFMVGMLALYSAKIWALVVEKLISPSTAYHLYGPLSHLG
jgi:CheY-like chemotaxis protein